MTLEFILWLVAWVVLSEGIFIILYLCDEWDTWILPKLGSFLVGGIFVGIQLVIVFYESGQGVEWTTPYYIRLLYEAIILAVIVALFFGNWLISKQIDKSRKKGRKK